MTSDLLLLFGLLQLLSAASAAPRPTPPPADEVKMKSKVKWLAEQVVVRINRHFQAPPGLSLSPPGDKLDGLSSVVTILEGYNSLIDDSLHNVAQIKYDVSSLSGSLRTWRSCGEGLKPSGALEQLQSRKTFIHSVSLEALLRLREFLNLLLDNLDQLQSC